MSDPIKRIFPGYGRGWGEERAEGKIARLFQRMREPATTDDMIWCIAAGAVFYALLMLAIV